MSLREVSDGYLAACAGKGDGAAFAELAGRYRGVIAAVTRWPTWGLSREDLRQEALIGLYHACRTHDRAREFGPLARACVRNQVYMAQLRARRFKQRVLSHAASLDYGDGHHADDGGQPMLADRLPALDGLDPAHVVQTREQLRQISRALKALTPAYRQALASEDRATAQVRYHARRRLQQLLEEQDAGQPLTRSDGRCHTPEQIERARELVAQGCSLTRAGAAVGAHHVTVKRWLKPAA